MVRWFDPRLLLRTLFMVVVARLFGTYADRRERDGGLPFDGAHRHDDAEELWFDYVADLGDGWDATTTIAGLLAADQLPVAGRSLPHGRVLVMGGDLVYPAASREEYLHRLEAPYYSVLPYTPEGSPRDLFVIPGNHDWYDGLAAFSRLFLQGRWFAGWRTRQSRSYFVLRLPQRWWFVGVDVQLDNDIDDVQLKYLLDATADVAPGDSVIIAGAVPYWLEPDGGILQHNMAFLERRLATERGASVRLSLAGDLHHYQRHAAADGRQRVTAGGGGAFLHGTAWQPASLREASGERWSREGVFPTPAASRASLWRLLVFPFLNPSFAVFLGAVLALLFWGIDAASHGLLFGNVALGGSASAGALVDVLPSSPFVLGGLLAFLAACVAFEEAPAHWRRGWQRAWRTGAGTLHGLLHLGVALQVLPLFAPSGMDHPAVYLGCLVLMVFAMAILSGLLFGGWLFVTYQLLGAHRDTVFSACRIAGWKHFLRMHIARDGTLALYTIGVRSVCRRWRERQPVSVAEALVEPADGVPLERRASLVDHIIITPAGKEQAHGKV